MRHLVIGQRQKAPDFSAFHWSPHCCLITIGQHYVTTRVVHLPKRTETGLITESDQSRANHQLLQLCTVRTAWSDSDQAVRAVHSCKSWFKYLFRSVIMMFWHYITGSPSLALYHRFTVFGTISQVHRLWHYITGSPSLALYHRFTVFGTISQVHRLWHYITGSPSLALYPRFTVFGTISQVHRLWHYITGSPSLALYHRFTVFGTISQVQRLWHYITGSPSLALYHRFTVFGTVSQVHRLWHYITGSPSLALYHRFTVWVFIPPLPKIAHFSTKYFMLNKVYTDEGDKNSYITVCQVGIG